MKQQNFDKDKKYMSIFEINSQVKHVNISALKVSSDKIQRNSESLSENKDKNISFVDSFRANLLEDNEKILKGVAKGIGYSSGILREADDRLGDIASSLRKSLSILTKMNSLSSDRNYVLREQLSGEIQKVKEHIESAKFNDRKLFTGELDSLSIQVGASALDKINFKVNNFSRDETIILDHSRLFRTSISTAINDFLAKGDDALTDYWNNPRNDKQQAIANNENLFFKALDSNSVTADQLGHILYSVIQKKPSLADLLDRSCQKWTKSFPDGISFKNATNTQITNAYNSGNNIAKNLMEMEMTGFFADKDACIFEISDRTTETDILMVRDILTNSLSIIRAEQASIQNQRKNLDSIRELISRTEQASKETSDRVKKPNFIEKSQEISEEMLKKNLIYSLIDAHQNQINLEKNSSIEILSIGSTTD